MLRIGTPEFKSLNSIGFNCMIDSIIAMLDGMKADTAAVFAWRCEEVSGSEPPENGINAMRQYSVSSYCNLLLIC
jgi:hypothetical protein